MQVPKEREEAGGVRSRAVVEGKRDLALARPAKRHERRAVDDPSDSEVLGAVK